LPGVYYIFIEDAMIYSFIKTVQD